MRGGICFLKLSSLDLGSPFKEWFLSIAFRFSTARDFRVTNAFPRAHDRVHTDKTSRRMSLKLSLEAKKGSSFPL